MSTMQSPETDARRMVASARQHGEAVLSTRDARYARRVRDAVQRSASDLVTFLGNDDQGHAVLVVDDPADTGAQVV